MRLLFLAAFIAVSGAAKLNNGYLPPPSAKSAGGHPEDLDVPLETPHLRSNQGNQPNRGGQPAGSYTNNFQGVVVDAAAAGTRTADTGLGLPRPAYGSEISKVGDAAFKTNEAAFNTAPQNFNQPGDVQNIANPGVANDGPDKNANIVKYEAAVGSEDFNFAFETDNGIMAEENGVATNGVQAQGAFSYKSDDGQTYSVSYTADENGYQPKGDHLPTPPPIPEEILKSLEQNARDEAAGIVDDGTYDASKYNAPREHNESDNGQYKAKQSNTGSSNGELNASGSLSGEESRPFAQLQHGTEQQTEHSDGNNNQFAQRGQQNNFGRPASNEYLPPQESRPQNAYRKPERVQSPEVSPYNNQQVNTQNSGRYQQAPQPQRPFNSASASASFGSDHSPAQQANQAPSTTAPNFQRPQSLSQQPLGNSFQHSAAQYNPQYNQQTNQQPTQEEPCCQDNSGPQPHNSASASASFHNSYNSRPNSASAQSSVSSQRNQYFQSHQNNPSTAAPNFQKPQGFTQQPLENMLFNSNRPESQQYTQQSSEEPHQENFAPQPPASASASFNNQVYSQRPNSASASASFSSQPRQQLQSQPNGQVQQYRPNQQRPQANQQYGQNTQNQGEVNNFEQQQQQDDSYYYNQPAKSFPTPTNSLQTTRPSFTQELGHPEKDSGESGSKEWIYNQKSVAQQGSSRFPSPPTLAPTFAPEPPTLPPRETEPSDEQHPQYQETQSFPSQASHPQQTTAVPKPFPQRQSFGQKTNNYQQSQASVIGQGTYNQPQAHESFPNQPSQQYDGEVYEYNKPEQTLTPGKDSSSQATEQTDVQSEENIDQSVDIQEPLAVQPTAQVSAEASYHGQGSSQASAQFRAPMPHGSPVAGKGEVFGGPRQPPSFNEQSGYHY